jgi:hypothetical protein
MGETKTNHVLVTGLPGSGKSTLCAVFKGRGINAVDADSHSPLLRWGKGEKLLERGAPIKWILRNPPMWDVEKMKELLAKNNEIYVFGIAPNILRVIPSFDRVIYLHGDGALIQNRLRSRTNNNFGTTNAQRRFVSAIGGFANLLIRTAATVNSSFSIFDASRPPEQLFFEIYSRFGGGVAQAQVVSLPKA